MRSLTIIYDPTCGLCTRLSQWLRVQRQYVPLRLVPNSSPMIATVYPELAESRFGEFRICRRNHRRRIGNQPQRHVLPLHPQPLRQPRAQAAGRVVDDG